MRYIVAEVPLSGEELRQCTDLIFERLSSGIVLLGAAMPEKCQLLAKVSDEWVSKGFSAHELLKLALSIVDGSGGGKPQAAQGGGKLPQKLIEALEKVKEEIQQKAPK